MSARNQQQNDLLQNVLFTFCLCTVVFTGWGIWSSLRVNRLLAERKTEESNLKALARELRDPKNVQALRDYRARQESEKNSGQIDTAVSSVLKNSANPLKIKLAPPTPPKVIGQGITEHSHRVTFNPAPINDVYAFLALLEAEQPHLEFRSLTVKSAKKRDTDPDEWELDVTLVTYTKTSG
jgi:hypothetical protein